MLPVPRHRAAQALGEIHLGLVSEKPFRLVDIRQRVTHVPGAGIPVLGLDAFRPDDLLEVGEEPVQGEMVTAGAVDRLAGRMSASAARRFAFTAFAT